MTNAFFKVTKKIASGSNSFRSYKPPFGQLPPFANPVRQRQQTVFSCVGPNNLVSLNTICSMSAVQPPGSAAKGYCSELLLPVVCCILSSSDPGGGATGLVINWNFN